jgi:uncharacterized membrane protein
MAMDAPVDVVVAAFPTDTGAREALHMLDDAKKRGVIAIKDAAVLTKDADNRVHISETADKGFGRGAVIGGVAGAAVGLLAGPIGWAALGGAAIGGLAAKLRDGGFRDESLRKMTEGLTPGSSALVAVIEETWVPEAQRMLEERGADLAVEAVAADVAAQLDDEAQRAQDDAASAPR